MGAKTVERRADPRSGRLSAARTRSDWEADGRNAGGEARVAENGNRRTGPDAVSVRWPVSTSRRSPGPAVGPATTTRTG
eukprot:5179276-Alexandrium_andersonii.AAC.1